MFELLDYDLDEDEYFDLECGIVSSSFSLYVLRYSYMLLFCFFCGVFFLECFENFDFDFWFFGFFFILPKLVYFFYIGFETTTVCYYCFLGVLYCFYFEVNVDFLTLEWAGFDIFYYYILLILLILLLFWISYSYYWSSSSSSRLDIRLLFFLNLLGSDYFHYFCFLRYVTGVCSSCFLILVDFCLWAFPYYFYLSSYYWL